MNRIVVSALILLASVAYACGPRARATETERKTVEGPPIISSLDVRIRDGVEFTFRVTNNERAKIELLFL
jgi:hypothetical protein